MLLSYEIYHVLASIAITYLIIVIVIAVIV